MKKNYLFFKKLHIQNNGGLCLNDEKLKSFLISFFDEFFITASITTNEDESLIHKSDLPEDFYQTSNKWSRYRHLKISANPIEMYQIKTDFFNNNFNDIEKIDWNNETILIKNSQLNINLNELIESQVKMESYTPKSDLILK